YDLDEIRLEGTNEIGMGDVSSDLQSKKASFVGAVPILKTLPLIGGLARGITSDDRIRRDRETIRSRMADLGFRSARVTSRIDEKREKGDIALVFHVEEGVLATVADVTFNGNAILSSPELHQTAGIRHGDHFSPTAARAATRNIKTA